MKTNELPKSKPILFSTPMVQAILDGSKTQTRRIIKKPPVIDQDSGYKFWDNLMFDIHDNVLETLYMPEHAPIKKGETLWVREEHYRFGKWIKNGVTKLGAQKWKFIAETNEVKYFDKQPEKFLMSRNKQNPESLFWYKRLARFMPKKDCRLFLQVTGVRAERLKDITEEDAMAEGVKLHEKGIKWLNYLDESYKMTQFIYNLYSAKDSYKTLWILINERNSWDQNPWVWVYEFERIEP